MFILYLVILAVILIVQYHIAKEFEFAASEKGYDESKYFHYCFWLGVIGYLMVIALPNRNAHNGSTFIQSSDKSNASLETDSNDDVSQKNEVVAWNPVEKTTAIIVGETNIKCTNCQCVQFKGNTTCVKCGAKFTRFAQR